MVEFSNFALIKLMSVTGLGNVFHMLTINIGKHNDAKSYIFLMLQEWDWSDEVWLFS